MLIGVSIFCNKCDKEMVQAAPESKRFICSNCLCSITVIVVTTEQIYHNSRLGVGDYK
jgi:hypothetical protein